MERRLLYHERLRIQETGDLGPLGYDAAPKELISAVAYHLSTGMRSRGRFASALNEASFENFGSGLRLESVPQRCMDYGLSDLPMFLSLMEIVAEKGALTFGYSAALPKFETKFNELADRHRFGYRMTNGEISRIGSPALTEEIVGPALLATRRSGWEQVEKSYKEALHHQRGPAEENDDALTAASAALESALKAVGIPGKTLGELAKAFKRSGLAAPQIQGVPETLSQLLERPGALRNTLGDAHGNGPNDDGTVHQELVDFVVHQVGSFIVYLAASSARTEG